MLVLEVTQIGVTNFVTLQALYIQNFYSFSYKFKRNMLNHRNKF